MLNTRKFLNLFHSKRNILFLLLSVIIALIIASVIFYESYHSYNSEISNVSLKAKNRAAILAKEMSMVFEKADFILEDIQEHELEAGREVSSRYINDYNRFLINEKNKASEVISFKIFDKNGDLVGDNTGIPKPINYADRNYFKSLKNSGINQLVISEPVLSKTLHRWVVVLARPLIYKNKFDGAVIAVIELDWLKQLFSNIELERGAQINLFNKENINYLKIPWDDKIIGTQSVPSSEMTSLVNSAEYNFTGISKLPGFSENVIVSMQKFENNNLVIVASFSLSDVLRDWKTRTVLYIFLIIIFSIAFFILLIIYLISLDDLNERQRQSIQTAKLASIGEMTAGIAHEINNPLTIISGQAQILKIAIKNNDFSNTEKLSTAVEKMNVTILRITRIIQGLKSFSRESSDERPSKVSIVSILDNAILLCNEKLKSEHIELKFTYDGDELIDCKEIQVEQVFVNLINNAADAIKKMPIKWLNISLVDEEHVVRISFVDSGKGIPAEIREKIMTPFFTTKEVGHGTGLGLSISHGIIQQHHGKLYVDAKAPNTTFVVELPKKR